MENLLERLAIAIEVDAEQLSAVGRPADGEQRGALAGGADLAGALGLQQEGDVERAPKQRQHAKLAGTVAAGGRETRVPHGAEQEVGYRHH